MWEQTEEAGKVAAILAIAVFFIAIAMSGAGFLVEGWTDVVAQYQQEREACLCGATTFLEYDGCR